MSTGLSWGQKIRVFQDWEVWDGDECYIATYGTLSGVLYRSFGTPNGIEFSIRHKAGFKPKSKFRILIDDTSKVYMFSHPNPKTSRARSHLWSHPKDDKRLDELFKKGTRVAFNPSASYNSVFSLKGYPEAVKLMDSNCVLPEKKYGYQ